MRPIALAMILTLAACTQFPELDSAVTHSGQNAKYPDLVPVDRLLNAATPRNGTPEQTVDTLNARVNALRNRANRLRGTVVDAPTRTRMRNGIADT